MKTSSFYFKSGYGNDLSVLSSLSNRHFLSSQALSLKEAEKTVLSDRVSTLQAELSAAALEAERMSREAAHYKEQEQVMRLLSEFISCFC